MVRAPNTAGASQFHKLIKMNPKNATAKIAKAAILSALIIHSAFMFLPSRTCELFINCLETPTQLQNRIALARQQGVDVHPGFVGNLLKTAAFHFVRHKHAALLFWKIVDGSLKLLEQHVSRIRRLWTGIGRWEQIFQLKRVVLFFTGANLVPGAAALLAETIDDPISGYAIEPGAHLLDRLHQAVGLNQFVENILQD